MSDTLPNWPPDNGEPIGEDRAREYIAWIRANVTPVLAEAERLISERYPGAEIHRAAVIVDQLPTWKLSPRMTGLSIGGVWCSYMAGSFAMVDIVITRDGALRVKPGINMRE